MNNCEVCQRYRVTTKNRDTGEQICFNCLEYTIDGAYMYSDSELPETFEIEQPDNQVYL